VKKTYSDFKPLYDEQFFKLESTIK